MSEPLGLGDPLHDPPNAKLDIIFVHGLGGGRKKTWTSLPTEEVPSATFWPRDLLPKVCNTARIYSFGYDSHFAHFYKPVAVGTTIEDHSASLIQSLTNMRSSTQTTDRPIVFVAHSLGGLVVANALSRQHGADSASKMLADHTCGTIYLGTPFEGSGKAKKGLVALKFASLFGQTKKDDLENLKEGSLKLASITDAFARYVKERDRSQTAQPMEVTCFFETHPTFVAGSNVGLVVPRESATLLGMDANSIAASHSGMCKFAGEWADGFVQISGLLARWIESIGVVKQRSTGSMNVTLGDVHYSGTFRNNGGTMAGNVFSTVERGNTIMGAVTRNYYSGSHKPQQSSKHGAPSRSESDDDYVEEY